MFVRWQLYKSQAQWACNDRAPRLKAILVESIRIDGKPRQKHVAFLGSVSLDKRRGSRFWYSVTTKLNSLGERVSPADRKRIESALAKRVEGRLLSKAELAQWDRHRAELLRTLSAPRG
jgi:hypothetical protein